MKVIKKHQDNIHHGPNCTVVEYPFEDKDIDMGMFYIFGRYPEKGLYYNEVCKMLIYVIRGEGILEIDGQKIAFETGDALCIPAQAKYCFEGEFEGAISSAPAWYPQQYKLILDY